MYKKIKLLLVTISYLKFTQLYYRFFYLLRAKIRKQIGFTNSFSKTSKPLQLYLHGCIPTYTSYKNDRFVFLNHEYTFTDTVDWNFAKHGKLWTYNLTYFDFLNQDDISASDGLFLVRDFISHIENIKDGLEPFPIALRGINWIKFLSKHNINDQKINDSLYAQYYILLDNLEYHLLGNHLLENGFSLLFGGYYFNDDILYNKAKEILTQELNEQILKDGAHFELSPMYHQIILLRVLDCINLLQNNQQENDSKLLEFLQQKASLMLGWLQNISFENGAIPLLNDSAEKIAPTTIELLEYSFKLNINIKQLPMKDSGYRKYKNERYECILDIGNIGPDYIPGHAHADTFNFELHRNNKPFIVDTGLSTYETNERRTLERSTVSHNTVEVNGISQSEVWGGFRVASRAYVIDLKEDHNSIKASHDGYKKDFDLVHERKFIFHEQSLEIIDTLHSTKEYNAVCRIHFHPSVNEDNILKLINLKNLDYKIANYKYAPEFNTLIDAKVLEIQFSKKLNIKIEI